MLQFNEIEDIDEYWLSGPNLWLVGGVILALNFDYFWRFHAFVSPSPRPPKRNSDPLENTNELTGAVPITY